MTENSGWFGRRLFVAAALACLMSPATATTVLAEEPSEAQILNALRPKPLTRSLSATPSGPSAEEQRFIDTLRAPTTRSLTVKEREQVAVIAQQKPSIDLEINFDFNSDVLNARGMVTATSLGQALSNPEMKGVTFLVAGHTDAKGGDAYNIDLSQRRSAAVKRFLVEKFGLTAENLVSVGYGKEKLKNTADPFAAENRRVQVVNLANKATAQGK